MKTAAPPLPAARSQPSLRQRLAHLWQAGIDVLEYQDEATFRRHLERCSWRSALAFVLAAALAGGLLEAFHGLLFGDALGSLLRAVGVLLLNFLIFTGGVTLVGRVLRSRGGYREVAFAFALFYVPLELIATAGSMLLAFVPYLNLLLDLGWQLAVLALEVTLAFRATRAALGLSARLSVWIALVGGGLLTLAVQLLANVL
ncbi:hypothetical protein HNR42_002629 [Deinobacterium chartae]|uniref:Yip1 domain-containing protein n=1 Tax=Deinobacterium chartae TaxID=521158 RepID=A0A841I079_9DEIO|nr:hypothetical protein [Deinobacterium chartae]MBB6099191.1 hypothetical protein [Deinobacterium chartae]